MATQLICKRCGRKLKSTPLNLQRGYGSVCWEKEGQFVTMYKATPQPEIEYLVAKIEQLEKQLFNLQAHPIVPRSALPPVPNGNGNGSIKERREIPLMDGGWDVSELQENPLFIKMQAVCEVV